MLQYEEPLPSLRWKRLSHNKITAEVADNVQPRLRSGVRANQRRTRLEPAGTQRLIKAVLASQPAPYSDDDLAAIAANCTAKEDSARKVEREMSKRIAAVAMTSRIGEVFDAIITGVTPHGTFVRVLQPHVEGLLVHGQVGVDVGDKLRVKLLSTDVQRGYIDFTRA